MHYIDDDDDDDDDDSTMLRVHWMCCGAVLPLGYGVVRVVVALVGVGDDCGVLGSSSSSLP